MIRGAVALRAHSEKGMSSEVDVESARRVNEARDAAQKDLRRISQGSTCARPQSVALWSL